MRVPIGQRQTRQRREILTELCGRKDHPDVEGVHSSVKARIPKLSLFTVYRTMNAFEHAGLVRRVTTFRGHARFDADMSQHAHFVCETCGAIHDVALPVRLPSGVSLPPETSDIASLPGRVRSTDVLMCGICHACTGMGAASA